MDFERARREFLFWRYFAPDCGGRGDGYGAAARGTTRHAELRGFRAQGTSARPSLRETNRGAGRASLGKTRPRGHFFGAPGIGKRYPGERAGQGVWHTASFDRRHAAGACRQGYNARLESQADHGTGRAGAGLAGAEDGRGTHRAAGLQPRIYVRRFSANGDPGEVSGRVAEAAWAPATVRAAPGDWIVGADAAADRAQDLQGVRRDLQYLRPPAEGRRDLR